MEVGDAGCRRSSVSVVGVVGVVVVVGVGVVVVVGAGEAVGGRRRKKRKQE